MASAPNVPFKVSLGDDVRRFRLPEPINLGKLKTKVWHIFGLDAHSAHTLQWQDEDGDMISVVNGDDFREALESHGTRTVRLYLTSAMSIRTSSASAESVSSWVEATVADATPSTSGTPSTSSLPTQEHEAAALLPAIPAPALPPHGKQSTGDAPEENTSENERNNAEVTQTMAAEPNVVDTPKTSVHATPSPEPQPPMNTESGDMVTHHYISCDATGMYPLRGVRWHRVGEDYDVCQEAFDKLDELEKTRYERIDRPGVSPVPYNCGTEHPGVICDITERPILGSRWHKLGENYDLCDTEFRKLAEHDRLLYELITRPGAVPVPYATTLRFNPFEADSGDTDFDPMALVRTILTALHTGYDIEIGLTPRAGRPGGPPCGPRGCGPKPGPGGTHHRRRYRGRHHDQHPHHQHGGGRHHHGRHSHQRSGRHHPRVPQPGQPHEDGCHRRQSWYHDSEGDSRQWKHLWNMWYAMHEGQDTKPAAAGTVLPDAPLGRGDFGPGVEQLQHFLIDHGLMNQNAIRCRAGVFGPRTAGAIKNFKASNDISETPDGIYDDATRRALLTVAGLGTAQRETNVAETEPTTEFQQSTPVHVSSEPLSTEHTGDATPATVVTTTPPVASQSVEVDDKVETIDTPPVEYPAERKILTDMGFADDARIIPLLTVYRGDIGKVIAELLQE